MKKMTTAHHQAPMSDQVDALLAKYDSIKKMIAEYEAALEPVELEVIGLVERFGWTPKNAERSKEFRGEIYRALVSRGISVKLDERKITQLRAVLKKSGASHFFRKLFTEEISHKLNPGAALFLAKLPAGGVATRIRGTFMSCQELKEQNPRVKVEEIAKKKAAKTGATA
jgi:hypothetical protein